jgi:hypothetical protein
VFNNCKKYNGTAGEIGQIGVACLDEFARLIELYGVHERFINHDRNQGRSQSNEIQEEN